MEPRGSELSPPYSSLPSLEEGMGIPGRGNSLSRKLRGLVGEVEAGG